MTHDPMCPMGDPRVIASVAAAMRSVGAEPSDECVGGYCDLIARVREDERSRERVVQTYEFGYRKGIAAAREAVAAQYRSKDNGTNYRDEDWDNAIDDALAAIDALVKP